MRDRWLQYTRVCLAMMVAFLAINANGQTTSRVSVSRTSTNLSVAWTGRGTLQTSSSLTGGWQDILEAPNPFTLQLTNANEFFRSISRWSTRSNLLEANSEMSV